MIRIYYGEDRVKINEQIKKALGENYEVMDGPELMPADLPSIFMGGSLFANKRAILIRDLGENKEVFEKLPEYLNTPHEVVLFETKLDKRTTTYKALKDKIEIKEFVMPANINAGLVFDIFKTAKTNGKKAVQMLEQIENEQDPYMFLGLLVSQALKDFSFKQGTKEKRVLQELSKLDIAMKSTSLQPFSLLKSFLLQVSSL